MAKQVYSLITTGYPHKYINHYGILVTDGNNDSYVYHCSGKEKNENGGCVLKTDYKEFTKNREPIYFFKTNLNEEEVEKQIKELYNKKWIPLIF